ncbi:hypothetical protein MMC11_002926 [Xylographa trunciseda]|nr:hypothetical protein [Xylographa trunciseda]
MPLPGRIFAGDEELGKKNDDHRPANGTIPIPALSWTRWKLAPKVRKRRLIIGLMIGLVVYFFFKNIPTDLGPIAQRIDTRVPGQTFAGIPLPRIPSRKPPHPDDESDSEKRYYDGTIKFYSLGASLTGIARTMGYRERNKNVLFAAASLQSVSRLIPVACEMSRWNRNTVHFALMGRDDLPLRDIQILNGVGPDCSIYWHDARPDYGPYSTDSRMETSVIGALQHIHSHMHPQVYIVEQASSEEVFFTNAIRSKGYETQKSVIELPVDALPRMMWITRLDYGSLQEWHNTYVDILIHAPTGSSGSLIRLLRSIEEADYFGCRRPHLTIELPTELDPPTWSFLQNLVWPPLDPSGAPHISQVTLRHRIPRDRLGSEEASVRFVESFYSARPQHSHVLVVSPQVQLSPLYYHYLIYNLLEYKYAAYGSHTEEAESLMGISLDLPSRSLDNARPFSAPVTKPKDDTVAISHDSTTIPSPLPFLWQAPNSNAALYFGDKWAEFHSFLSNRLLVQHRQPSSRTRIISPEQPSWTEYLLELMRTRGYSLLYPNLISDSLATVHNELYQIPEETTPLAPSEAPFPQIPDSAEPFIVNPLLTSITPISHQEQPLLTTPLLTILPSDGDLPTLSTLPLLSYFGEALNPLSSKNEAVRYANDFRSQIGRCKSGISNAVAPMKADDLFCVDQYDDILAVKKPIVADTPWQPPPLPEKPETKQEFLAHLARQAGHPGREI